jgi:hypothetical protein
MPSWAPDRGPHDNIINITDMRACDLNMTERGDWYSLENCKLWPMSVFMIVRPYLELNKYACLPTHNNRQE